METLVRNHDESKTSDIGPLTHLLEEKLCVLLIVHAVPRDFAILRLIFFLRGVITYITELSPSSLNNEKSLWT